jgi:WhiB family redox-sensing transcriptional regulator
MRLAKESEMADGVVRVGDYHSTVDELLDLLQRPNWQADALCREYPQLGWFSTTAKGLQAAKAVCAGCLVRAECLSYALADPSLTGTWGGLTAQERNLQRRTILGSLDRLTATA